MIPQQVLARNAVEALRSGVPSRHAVEELGTTQIEIKEAFESRLSDVASGQGVEPLMVAADFGQGKSHLLNYLRAVAARQGFVTSFATISPEMPPGNAHVVLKAIAESAEAPGRTGQALRALASGLRTNSSGFANLRTWARDSGIDDRFNALLYLFEETRNNDELLTQILGDIEGTSIPVGVIRQAVREAGQAAGYSIRNPKAALIAHDRIRLLAQFYRACGAKGWVILFDELERFALFTAKQRIPAWEEFGWWSEAAREDGAAILPVFAGVHEGIKPRVEEDRPRFRTRSPGGEGNDSDQRALAGIELVANPPRLIPPTNEQLNQILYRVKGIYEHAYGRELRPIGELKFDPHATVRSQIRRWITRWDLERCYPEYQPSLVEEEVVFDTSEISDEVSEAGEADESGGVADDA